MKESLIDFVKPCHKEEYVAIFDLVPTMQDLKCVSFQRIRVAREHDIIGFSMVFIEAN